MPRTRQQAPPLSPEWWVTRLYDRLIKRRDEIDYYDRYYRGDFDLPWLAPQAQDEFRRILTMCRANYMGLVVDAQVERMNVEGFRLGASESAVVPSPPTEYSQLKRLRKAPGQIGKADLDTWRIWQANNMDGDFDQGMLEASIGGHSYLLTAPNLKDVRTPHIWVEHASQAIVEFTPGTNRRETAAGLKVWIDDWTSETCATLYLPAKIYKYRAPNIRVSEGRERTAVRPRWEPRQVRGETWPLRNTVGEVPLYELANNPRLLNGGISELADLTDIQDRINKTLADRLMTQDYGAFPQKWASAWPEVDAAGNPSANIDVGRNRMVTTDIEETKFGQWDGAELDPYSEAKREDVKDIASRSRTPAQYLLGELNNVNGETLKASESGLVSKVRQRTRGHSDPLERAMNTIRRLAGLTKDKDEVMEVVWRNPEFRTEGELVDALFKMSGLGVPQEALWERWGATPPEIERWKLMASEQRQRTDLLTVLAERYRMQATADVQPPQAGATGQQIPARGKTTIIDADKDGLLNEDDGRRERGGAQGGGAGRAGSPGSSGPAKT